MKTTTENNEKEDVKSVVKKIALNDGLHRHYEKYDFLFLSCALDDSGGFRFMVSAGVWNSTFH